MIFRSMPARSWEGAAGERRGCREIKDGRKEPDEREQVFPEGEEVTTSQSVGSGDWTVWWGLQIWLPRVSFDLDCLVRC